MNVGRPGRFALVLVCALSLCSGSVVAAEAAAQSPAARRALAVEVLRESLQTQPQWIKVHAAEFLLALDYRDGIRERFEAELSAAGEEPQYRIGIWRVLAREAVGPDRRDHFTSKIRAAFLDTAGPDRLHALETLGKLHYQAGSVILDPQGEMATSSNQQRRRELADDELQAFAIASESDDPAIRACARWVQLNSAGDEPTRRAAEQRLAELLTAPEERARMLAAYVFTWQASIDESTWSQIDQAAQAEKEASPAHVHLVAARLLHAPNDVDASDSKDRLMAYAVDGSDPQRTTACNTLAQVAGVRDADLLAAILQDDQTPPDVRVSAANAVCRIGRRQTQSLAGIDWAIIVAYGIGMIVVGWIFSRDIATTDDYMLGGRNMRSWAVGLSLFATLLSTITYLAQPGEMIKNGPMILCLLLAFPFIFVTVCYLIIPFIMRLRVTSAYELLEKRFGVSVRLLGATIFLLLRLLWMSVIIFATTDKVLIPLLDLDPTIWTPVVCAVLGLITLIYTSLGGLKAVVFTDVVQTAILFGGAILALLTITVSMGGVAAWFPKEWSPRWAPPAFGFQTDARITLGWAMVSAYIWYVCTSASDQMAIQRYLATRDVKAARRAYFASMTCDAVVTSLLALLGLALFAYFQAHPYHIPDGETLAGSADRLFPRFIVFGLPAGITGLVVAGLLAAAMSSLSSGMNSSCAVITTDFIDRFKEDSLQETDHIRLAKYVAVVIGVTVVGLSLFVSLAPGNLLEIAYKVVNLFTVPLSILFFMAMFVPWATTFGVWAGALCSALAAIFIAYWTLLVKLAPVSALLNAAGVSVEGDGPSFLFIMPVALVVGMLVGPLASMLPIGPPAKRNLHEITGGVDGE